MPKAYNLRLRAQDSKPDVPSGRFEVRASSLGLGISGVCSNPDAPWGLHCEVQDSGIWVFAFGRLPVLYGILGVASFS